MTNHRAFGLDLVRSVAILMVLISHVRIFVPIGGNDNLYTFGYLGVDLFFVLSGFLIGGILIKTFERDTSLTSLKRFWVRRWFRTLPNYYLFLIVNICLVLFVNRGFIWPEAKLPQFLVFLQNFGWKKPPFFTESWSLCVEEWFYLLYPICVLILRMALKQKVKRCFILATLIFFLFPILYRLFAASIYSYDEIRMIVMARFDGMMAGVFIALCNAYYPELYKRLKLASGVVGAVLIIGVTVIYQLGPKEFYFLKILLPTLLSVGFALVLPLVNMMSTPKLNIVAMPIEKISLWSYSLYLVNVPVRTLMLFVKAKFHLSGLSVSLLGILIFFGLSIFLSALIFKYFEKPFLVIRDKRWGAKSHEKNILIPLS